MSKTKEAVSLAGFLFPDSYVYIYQHSDPDPFEGTVTQVFENIVVIKGDKGFTYIPINTIRAVSVEIQEEPEEEKIETE